jgi:transposase
MLRIQDNIRVYIAVGITDMRKSINGLSLLVQEEFELDLFSGSLFAFCNRRQDIVKILYWAENGFCLWMKRLEKETFRWHESEGDVLEVSQVALGWLLQGLDLSQAHHRLDYSSAG